MQVIDASSIVLAWDIYPIDQFPKFWDWIDAQLTAQYLVMADPNYVEVGHASPDCKSWLSGNLKRLQIGNDVIKASLEINEAIGVLSDDYHPDGVDENDVLCIATAVVNQFSVISDEALQPSLPQNMKKYKIPAVCDLSNVGVQCINLNKYVRNSKIVF